MKIFPLFLCFALANCTNYASEPLSKPREAPLIQNSIHPNSCGPCALTHAFAYASSSWRTSTFFEKSYATQVREIIENNGSKTSTNRSSYKRWNPRKGMNTEDLTAIANEQTTRSVISISTSKTSSDKDWLFSAYKRLKKSLDLGFPPILSIKQQIHKKFKSKEGYYWVKTKGHFITILTIEAPQASDPTVFEFTYIDSYTGQTHTGKISNSSQTFLTTSPLTRKAIEWKTRQLKARLPDLKISVNDVPTGGKITT